MKHFLVDKGISWYLKENNTTSATGSQTLHQKYKGTGHCTRTVCGSPKDRLACHESGPGQCEGLTVLITPKPAE